MVTPFFSYHFSSRNSPKKRPSPEGEGFDRVTLIFCSKQSDGEVLPMALWSQAVCLSALPRTLFPRSLSIQPGQGPNWAPCPL